jgi:hypothetical protein
MGRTDSFDDVELSVHTHHRNSGTGRSGRSKSHGPEDDATVLAALVVVMTSPGGFESASVT